MFTTEYINLTTIRYLAEFGFETSMIIGFVQSILVLKLFSNELYNAY